MRFNKLVLDLKRDSPPIICNFKTKFAAKLKLCINRKKLYFLI